MRTIERTSRFKRDFKRDFKRESRGKHRKTLDVDIMKIIVMLASDKSLDTRMRDHALGENWTGFRDCQIHHDLVLIYAKPDDQTLQLVPIGSHSDLGL